MNKGIHVAQKKSAASKAEPAADGARKERGETGKSATGAKRTSARKTQRKSSSAKAEEGAKTAATKTSRAPKKAKKAAAGGKSLVVVESPAKARTIEKYLGPGFTVKASVGHIKDLPKSRMGVDVEHGFEPEYVVIRDKKKVITDIRKAAKGAEAVFLAPDPDREGEAIAWHIAEEVRDVNPNIKRVLFNEITKKSIQNALAEPGELDSSKADAQQARRILDRLVGYQISPILWKKVRRGLSAGRVQSVAVKLVVDRERDIEAFVPEEYWSVEADCSAGEPPPFVAKIHRFRGEKAAPKTEADAAEIAEELRGGPALVAKVERKERKRRPAPPFITSKLQQDAARKLRFSAKRTMALAQRLYEGLDLEGEGPTGLITYMRTDSTRISDDALGEVRGFIGERYGEAFCPEKPNVYKSSKKAQDAHEAIRPTSTHYTPERIGKLLASHPEGKELTALYTLIWQRFVASQMTPAVYDQTTVDIARGEAVLRATGQILKFPGFTTVYQEQESDDAAKEKSDSSDRLLPPLAEGQTVSLDTIRTDQHFTQPPPRFSEASLVKELEDKGIGRPSTYAAILSTIADRGYVEKKEARFHPTELGTLVNDLLVTSFPNILDVDFTAQMEEDLDKVEEGGRDWKELLGGFYTPFQSTVEKAKDEMRDVKREEIPTEHVCEKCGSQMVIKWGRNGSFLACSGYPDCRNTKEIERKADGSFEIVPEPTTDEKCESCGADMVVKRGRFGSFLACSRYPDCKTTKPISIGVDCPREGCGGFLTEKRSKRGKVFYGCSNYAKKGCDFVSWDRPIAQACPQCGAAFLTKKETKRGVTIKCLSCDYKETGETAAA